MSPAGLATTGVRSLRALFRRQARAPRTQTSAAHLCGLDELVRGMRTRYEARHLVLYTQYNRLQGWPAPWSGK